MFTIRPMRPEDNAAMLKVIQQCVLEYGYTHSPYVTHAEEEGDIYGGMQGARSAMYVLTDAEGVIVGGGGFAPVEGNESLCEIKRVYFAPRVRGHGWGKTLVKRLMDEAAALGYAQFYIETVPEMATAVALYEKLGFTPAPRQSQGGHDCCSIFMLRPVSERNLA